MPSKESEMPQPLTDEQAINAALAAIEGKVSMPPGVVPRVERQAGHIVVTFPTSHPPGFRGADFHAQVTLHPDTGEIIQLLGGQ
jgi:hypothetical protein